MHRQLKEHFGGEQTEVAVSGFRIDAIEADGRLVEVQSGALGPLRAKLDRLLTGHQVRVVKPVVVSRRIVKRNRADGPDISARSSPKRGDLIDVFDDLVGLARIFPHENLRVSVLAVAIDEVRISRRRRPGFQVVDRRLNGVVEAVELREARDLWTLLPGDLTGLFTTIDLAESTGRSVDFTQRIAYCLRLAGAAKAVGKVGNRLVYERTDETAGIARPT